MPVPPPPIWQTITITSRRISTPAASVNFKPRRLSLSSPLLGSTPFHYRRPLALPLAPRTARLYSANGGLNSEKRQSFYQRLREALTKTRIAVGLGIGVFAFTQFQKRKDREVVEEGRDQKQKRIRPDGPWQVQVLSTLPLKALSRAWGRFNEIQLPVFLRAPGFKLYSWVFGVNLDEVEHDNLQTYRNLSEFFYRRLKPGVRPINPRSTAIVSPADGSVIHFGEVIPGGQVEQVKGMTYSLDALLGAKAIAIDNTSPQPAVPGKRRASHPKENAAPGVIDPDETFAVVNGISYTVPTLLQGDSESEKRSSTQAEAREAIYKSPQGEIEDTSLPPEELPTAAVVAKVAKEVTQEWWRPSDETGKKMYFCVIYLAPGDYHRFHSPTSWVVERRRHFAGELYSVSPYLQRTLPNLFTLNERVVLLGRWRYGLFTMTPVGATNVGSIVINFDKELRTNSLTHDSKAITAGGYYEAVYRNASWLLGGVPVRKGEEVGGFKLGSTIVLVFEAPEGDLEKGVPGWHWEIERGQKLKVGQALGAVE